MVFILKNEKGSLATHAHHIWHCSTQWWQVVNLDNHVSTCTLVCTYEHSCVACMHTHIWIWLFHVWPANTLHTHHNQPNIDCFGVLGRWRLTSVKPARACLIRLLGAHRWLNFCRMLVPVTCYDCFLYTLIRFHGSLGYISSFLYCGGKS